uniref:hypothetical protein n=1 Tax=Vibrio cholerae TaxID=666 RepID=UPI0030F41370
VVVFEFGVMRCQPLRRALNFMEGTVDKIAIIVSIFSAAIAFVALLIAVLNKKDHGLLLSTWSLSQRMKTLE